MIKNCTLSATLIVALAAMNAAADHPIRNQVEPSKEVLYNEGVRLYRDNQWSQAAECFRRASQSESQQLAAKARYNLGNCHYASALERTQNGGGVDEVVPVIRDAIASYRSSLRLNPDDVDARANLELAVRALDQLTQPKNKQPDQSPQDQQDNSQQQPQQDNDDQSQSPENQSPENQSPENQDSSQQQEQQQSDGESSEEQSSETEKQQSPEESDTQGEQQKEEATEPPEDQGMDDGKPSGINPDAQSQPQESENQSQTDQNQGDSSDRDTPEDDSNESTTDPDGTQGESMDSSGELEAVNEPNQADETKGAIASEQATADEGKLMTQQEAMKMLQAIRDRDLLRRYQQERSERSRYVPVERDW